MDDTDSAFDSSSQTLAAGYTSTGVLIQVTDRSIRLAAPREPALNLVSTFQIGQTVIASAIHGNQELVATAIRSDQGIYIHIRRIVSTNDSYRIQEVGDPAKIDYEPISMLVEDVERELYMFIGSNDGRLVSYHVGQEGISHLGSHMLSLNGDLVSKAIESISLVAGSQENGLRKSTIFCGLRSGVLVPLNIQLVSAGEGKSMGKGKRPVHDVKQLILHYFIDIKQGPVRRLGQTVVKISSDVTRDNFVLVTCGDSFWCLSNGDGGDASNYCLHQIWITDQNNVSLRSFGQCHC
jgi:hypothetical protein